MDLISYIIGLVTGQKLGTIDITGNISCTDDGQGNITITMEDN